MAESDSPSSFRLSTSPNPRASFAFFVAVVGTSIFLASQVGGQTTWIGSLPLVQQPAFWPIVAIGGMALFGLSELLVQWRSGCMKVGPPINPELFLWLKVLEYVVWFMIYVWLVPMLGYLPTTMLFCLSLTYRAGYRSKKYFISSLSIAFAIVIAFKALLKVRIPGGVIYEYLPAALRNIMILYF